MDKIFEKKVGKNAERINTMKILYRTVKKKYNLGKHFLRRLEKEGKLLPVGRNPNGERIYEEEDIKKFIDSLPSY